MSFKEFYESDLIAKCNFKGVCDRIRKTPEGEMFWHDVMDHKVEISEEEFLDKVDPYEILDPEENWEEYKSGHSDQIKYYKSNDIYFFQTSGFEYFWET